MKKNAISRRQMLAGSAVAVAGIATHTQAADEEPHRARNNNLKQAACRWCLGKIPIEDLCKYATQTGLHGIDLVGPNEWPILKKHNLICTMIGSHGITKGLNRIENHDECIAKIRASIDNAVDAGFPNVICFSGNRDGMDDDEGLKNCEIGVKKIVGYAEEKKINLCMELLNSKRNHKDYMCDRTHWGGELARRVGSDRFGLLYDIYHMQVQEGDIIATIKEYKDCIKHFHTAGVPGRGPIHLDQEINYPPIIKAILKTGYQGYLAHEFSSRGSQEEQLDALTRAVEICDL